MTAYDRSYFSGLEKADRTEVPRNLRILKAIEKYYQRYNPKNKGTKTILDVGVGTGLFLYLSSKFGWELYGVDISEYATEGVKKRLNIEAYAGEITQAPFKKNYFDAINMRHTIEHVKNPKKDLEKAFKLLKPGGIIAIATPNSFGIHSKIFGKEWPHWSLPYHLHFFSKKTLKELVESSGFEVLELKTEEITIFDPIKKILTSLGIPLNYKRPSRISLFIDKLIAYLGFGEGLLLIARKGR